MIDLNFMIFIRRMIDKGEVPQMFMYLDSEGHVTVGSGTKLPTSASAAEIPFYHDKTGKDATKEEVEAEWKRLHVGSTAQRSADPKHKHPAGSYASESDLRIQPNVSDALRDKHIYGDYMDLKKIYRNFDEFPDNAKLALFDMIYNLGPGQGKTRHHRANGLRAFAAMNQAISKKDWVRASKHCHRIGIPIDRNKMPERLFMACSIKMLPR